MPIREEQSTAAAELIADFERIRRFNGPPAEFWPAFLEQAARLVGARIGLLLLKGEAGWGRMSVWPARSGAMPGSSGLIRGSTGSPRPRCGTGFAL